MKLMLATILLFAFRLGAADLYFPPSSIKVEFESPHRTKIALEVSAAPARSVPGGARLGTMFGGEQAGTERGLKAVALTIGSNRISVPAAHLALFKNPVVDNHGLYKRGRHYCLGLSGGDGERSYTVVFVFSESRYAGFYTRFPNGRFLSSTRSFLRGKIRGREDYGMRLFESGQCVDLIGKTKS